MIYPGYTTNECCWSSTGYRTNACQRYPPWMLDEVRSVISTAYETKAYCRSTAEKTRAWHGSSNAYRSADFSLDRGQKHVNDIRGRTEVVDIHLGFVWWVEKSSTSIQSATNLLSVCQHHFQQSLLVSAKNSSQNVRKLMPYITNLISLIRSTAFVNNI